MSLIIATICPDGAAVSGDFRRSRTITDPKTGIEKFEAYDDQHKLIRTKSNRIIGTTGNIFLKDGRNIKDAIEDTLVLTEILGLSMYEEFEHLVGCLKDDKVALIETGILDDKMTVLVWEQGDYKISLSHTGGAIGATDFLKNHKEEFESEIKGSTTTEAARILQKYNKFTAESDRTVSPECEVFYLNN